MLRVGVTELPVTPTWHVGVPAGPSPSGMRAHHRARLRTFRRASAVAASTVVAGERIAPYAPWRCACRA